LSQSEELEVQCSWLIASSKPKHFTKLCFDVWLVNDELGQLSLSHSSHSLAGCDWTLLVEWKIEIAFSEFLVSNHVNSDHKEFVFELKFCK
jgi:hypothetical protein